MRQVVIAQALFSGFCFGFLGLFGKAAYEAGLRPGEFLSLRFLFACLLLAPWLAWRSPEAFQISRSGLLRSVALGVGGYAVFSSCFFFALQGLSASLTVLLLYTYPVVVSLGAWALFGERMKRLQLIALPVVSLGLGLLVWGDMEVRSALSLTLGLLAALFYSAYILASSRLLRGIPPFTSVFYIMLSAGIVLGALHLRPETLPAVAKALPAVSGAALICSVLAMGFFLAALQKLTNAEISLLSTAEPITGVAVAALFLNEKLFALQWSGAALILSGMVLVAFSQRRP